MMILMSSEEETKCRDSRFFVSLAVEISVKSQID